MFGLDEDDLYRVDGPVNLNRLHGGLRAGPAAGPQVPAVHPERARGTITDADNILAAVRRRDILLHHPYESFAPVLDFISRSAQDPDVLSIKLTLYRTGHESPIVDSLVAAAQAGKEVTVLVELRARFDEAENINLANRLQEAGAHVVYGVVGYKTHCKMALVVRREGTRLQRYVHLGTGNYHPGTARLYTDYGLLSADPVLAEDVHQVFLQLTSLMRTPPLKRLHEAPFTLHKDILALIEQEIANVTAGGNGHIVAKLNALVEPEVIRALYRASGAGRDGRPDRPRAVLPATGHPRRIRQHPRAAPSSGASSSTPASTTSMPTATKRCCSPAPTGWSATSSGASRLCFSIEDDDLKARLLADLDTCLSDNSRGLGTAARRPLRAAASDRQRTGPGGADDAAAPAVAKTSTPPADRPS